MTSTYTDPSALIENNHIKTTSVTVSSTTRAPSKLTVIANHVPTSSSGGAGINSSASSTPPISSTPTLGHHHPHPFSMPCTPPLGPNTGDSIPIAHYDLNYANTEAETKIVGSYRGIEPFATYRQPTAVPASYLPSRGVLPTGIYSRFTFKGKFTMTNPTQPYGASPSKALWSSIPDCHNNRPIAQSAPQTQLLRSRDDITIHN